MYIRNTELIENGNFHLFAAKGKQKQQTPVCFLHMEKEKRKMVFLVSK
jgi:hypothetical protein